MTLYAKPPSQRPQNWLATLRTLATTNAATSTQYVVEYPERKAGDTRKESLRGASTGIIGNLAYDHAGNPTGLTGWGQGSHASGTWKKL